MFDPPDPVPPYAGFTDGHPNRLILEEKSFEQVTVTDVCRRVVRLPKYQVIFHDETIYNYVVNRIFQCQRKKLALVFMKVLNLSKKEAELLTLFVITGTYNVNICEFPCPLSLPHLPLRWPGLLCLIINNSAVLYCRKYNVQIFQKSSLINTFPFLSRNSCTCSHP